MLSEVIFCRPEIGKLTDLEGKKIRVNAIGHPAITFPADPASDGMPIGAQLVGAWNQDWQLLRLAHAYEQVHPFADRWPDLALSG